MKISKTSFTLPFVLLAICLCLFTTCNTIRDTGENNVLGKQEDLKNQLSEIHLPISYSTKKLEDLLNKQLKPVIYQDDSFDKPKKDNLKIKVMKAGKVIVEVEGNVVNYVLPLSIECELRKKPLPIVKTSFSLKVRGKSSVEIEKNWKLKTKSKFLGIEWIEHPKLNLGFAEFDLTNKVEKVLNAHGDEIFHKLDLIVKEKADIKHQIEQIWYNIQKPICINRKEKKIWLKFDNQDISASQVYGHAGNLLIHTKIHAYIQTIVADTIEHYHHQPLPNLTRLKAKDKNDQFDMFVLSVIPFDDLNAILQHHVGGKVLAAEGHSMTIKEAALFGEQGNLALKINFSGEIQGEVKLKTAIYHDSTDNALLLKEFDFLVESDDMLVQVADWLLHDKVKAELSKYLKIPLQPHIERLPELINKGVEHGKTGKRIDLVLKNMKLHPQKILITPNNIQLLIHTKGNGMIILDKLGKLE
ncbi:MAG: hypothetical protein OHK0038_19010 [Flammeovirgaceae bacterium]